MAEPVSRGEFDLVTASLDRLHEQVTAIDNAGPRGMAVLSMRVEQLATAMTEHEREHRETQKQRRADVWRLIGALAVMVAPIYPVLVATR